ncbi:MAG: hypothetical protein Unbinned6284contig1004_4 [Prokaryotic dsDNA virus sp.]|nr:MAG: hypothetical protein Unbinned6284contig1004_4 [Prokaryotic dsDNA virus sp.]|tara:strand:+ start:20419 stop:21993 length:1575 start_codon:yes stop_codon:yes gene_type:complete
MVDIRLPNGKIITNVPDNLSKQEIRQKIIDSGVLRGGNTPEIGEVKTVPELFETAAKGTVRSFGRTIPLIGGFTDDIEAGIRAIGDSTREDELKKIRAEEAEYKKMLEDAGLAEAQFATELGGSIVGGMRGLTKIGNFLTKFNPNLAKTAQTAKGQVALGTGIGAVEGAGFADEEAGTGALVGGAIGGAVPIVGRGIARAIGKTDDIAGKEITDIASENADIKKLLTGIKASDDVAQAVEPLADRALQGTEQRVQKTILDTLGVESVDEIAAPARAEYTQFINRVGNETVPEQEAVNLFERKTINDIAKRLVADNPQKYANVQPNSIGFLQDVKSRAAAQGRTGSENAPAFQDASRAIKETIDTNFGGFKELNQKFAQAIEAEDLANRITNLNIQEDGNIAKSILKGQNKRDLAKSFGSSKADELVENLRKESNRTQALKRLKTRATNELQGVKDIEGAVGSGTPETAISAARKAIGAAGRSLTGNQAKREALELLQGGKRARVSPQLQAIISQQLAKQYGGQE